ncbi:hypothetical protein ASG11_01510 [Sphingomonas sp. Leaf357]|uniref:hypothetical protein n=1 Tax=Sphingomonas sp. Leaf357 TaxID=1736350 RepID=UPI0006F92D8D|nr:hypothetical protein [Sphingomonas sp. Leaf357]KQS03104.1 hypothetical protein ASG11_01510 [Sphingomonas sp. Leaf357]
MTTIKGRDAVRRYLLEQTPKRLKTLMRGAAKAGATVIAEEAKQRSISHVVDEAITIKVPRSDGITATAKVTIEGRWANSLALWLEYGTSPHFIMVDESQRAGRSVKGINKTGGLVIGGKFVGDTVHHPGARPHPFLRPALDLKEAEAIAAAQAYIDGKRGGSADD